MSTVAHWAALQADFPDSPPPFLSRDGQGRAFLGFDDSTDESCVFQFVAPQSLDTASGNQQVSIYWRADTATSGDVIWNVEVEAISPDDATDTDAASSYAAVQSVTDTAPATAGIVTRADVSLTTAQADGITAGDIVRVRVTRDADNANDDLVGDAEILFVEYRDGG